MALREDGTKPQFYFINGDLYVFGKKLRDAELEYLKESLRYGYKRDEESNPKKAQD